ncbi:MAG: zinc ribbon domain-containing protein [Candidatus Thorarchaeota archaeon]|nr:zinc ribbon domain-containing protein [Candidatus Thorarchaeota archaeon]
MGDFGIPGAPFVLSLPDDWNVSMLGLPGESPVYMAAFSPEKDVSVVYYRFPVSSIDEILENIDESASSTYSMLRFNLNGMDCLVFTTEIVYYGEDVSLWTFDAPPYPLHPPSMSTDPSPTANSSVAYVEHQGVVIRIAILAKKDWAGSSEPAALLVLSGVTPGSPFSLPDEDPFSATAVSPLDAMKQQMSLLAKPLQHKGARREKDTGPKPDFHLLRDHLVKAKPLTWCLTKLQEISKALEENREYGHYSQDLNRIHDFLEGQWGLAEAPAPAEPPISTKTPRHPPEPASSTAGPPPTGKRESTVFCSKCGSPMQSTEKFCRECGTPCTTKSTRWSPRSKS